jgi:hopanoid biosynthesis associated protein HpnK
VKRRLIVTADDFGASRAINEAVERAYREGVLTAASLMVGAPEAADAVERARTLRTLGVGLHLALVNARPMLSRKHVAALVGRDGAFDRNLLRAGWRYFAIPRVRRQLQAEIRAQFEAFAATGLVLDHVDAHNHMHVHPTLFDMILDIGSEFGMRAMRVPSEPPRPSWRGLGNAILIGPWASLMRRRLRRAGIRANDALFGLNDTGRMDEGRILAILGRLPPGLSELYCHPTVTSDDAYARTEELDALLSANVRAAIERRGIQLARYADVLT